VNLLERARIEAAVLSYDFWLESRGTAGRRRRGLRRELRANLLDAAERTGARAAVHNLGSTRRMAAESVCEDRRRPRWNLGLQAAVSALMLTLLVEFLTALAWVDGATAARPDHQVNGSIALFPGSSMQYTPPGVNMMFGPGWLCLAIGLFALVTVARPWRVLTGRTRDRRDPLVAQATPRSQ
jgi:hypothetical protein